MHWVTFGNGGGEEELRFVLRQNCAKEETEPSAGVDMGMQWDGTVLESGPA